MDSKRPLSNILEWIESYASQLSEFPEHLTSPYYDELAKMEDRIEDIHNAVEEAQNDYSEEDDE